MLSSKRLEQQRAARAHIAHLKLIKLTRKWKPIGKHEHLQLKSEPDYYDPK